MLGRLSGLQKLRCIFTKCWDDCNSFPELSCLSRLESLKVCFSGKVHSPSKFSFPANLKKLMLSSFQLPWNEISAIGRFPNLEVLKLLDRAFEEQQWEMNEGELQNLKFLKLDLLNITTWIVSSEHLRSLEQIVLHRCKHLQEIPSGLGEIPTLEIIEMRGCSPSAKNSVKLIQKEQSDLENDQPEVHI